MTLSQILKALKHKKISGTGPDFEVRGVVYDPLRVKDGFIFVAINIYTQLDKIEIPDGHSRVGEAINNGARAVVLREDLDVPDGITKIIVPDSRYALGILANEFYGHPSENLKLIGVTGTNGKTTITHIVESIFIQDFRIGLIGTLYFKMNGVIHQSKDTTPEPPDLQAIFRRMADGDYDQCVLEASSHGIDFNRLQGCRFDVAAFSNFSQDHLDYHLTMENYLNTKLRLFQWLEPEHYAVINIDDPASQHFIKSTKAKVITYGINSQADISAKNINLKINRTNFTLKTPVGEIEVESRLIGLFNVYNALAAVGIAYSQDFSLEKIKSGLEKPIRVSGRFELVDKGQSFSVVVDYAHSPDGLENVLGLAKKLTSNRLIAVFGCGGDRDRKKRPLMGEIVSKYGDYFIITSDNPRNENPQIITGDIVAGVTHDNYDVIINRREAIEQAITLAQPGDIILLLGKGHETTQTIKDKIFEFNDYKVAEEILEKKNNPEIF